MAREISRRPVAFEVIYDNGRKSICLTDAQKIFPEGDILVLGMDAEELQDLAMLPQHVIHDLLYVNDPKPEPLNETENLLREVSYLDLSGSDVNNFEEYEIYDTDVPF